LQSGSHALTAHPGLVDVIVRDSSISSKLAGTIDSRL